METENSVDTVEDKIQQAKNQVQPYIDPVLDVIDLSNEYHQMAIVAVVLTAAYAVKNGSLPISVPLWQILVLAAFGIVFYLITFNEDSADTDTDTNLLESFLGTKPDNPQTVETREEVRLVEIDKN